MYTVMQVSHLFGHSMVAQLQGPMSGLGVLNFLESKKQEIWEICEEIDHKCTTETLISKHP